MNDIITLRIGIIALMKTNLKKIESEITQH